MTRVLLFLILMVLSSAAFAAEEECDLLLQTNFARGTSRLLRSEVITPAQVLDMANSAQPRNPVEKLRPTTRNFGAQEFYRRMLALPETSAIWEEIRAELRKLLVGTQVLREIRDEAYAHTAATLKPLEIPRRSDLDPREIWQWLRTRDGRMLYALLGFREISVREFETGKVVARLQQDGISRFDQIAENAQGDLEAVFFAHETPKQSLWERLRYGKHERFVRRVVNLRTGASEVNEISLPLNKKEDFRLVRASSGPDLVTGTRTVGVLFPGAPLLENMNGRFSAERCSDGSVLLVERMNDNEVANSYAVNVSGFDGEKFRKLNVRPIPLGNWSRELKAERFADGRFVLSSADRWTDERGRMHDRIVYVPPSRDGSAQPLNLSLDRAGGQIHRHSLFIMRDGRILVVVQVNGGIRVFDPERSLEPIYSVNFEGGAYPTFALAEVGDRLFMAVLPRDPQILLFEPLIGESVIGAIDVSSDLAVSNYRLIPVSSGQVFVTVEARGPEEHTLRVFTLFNAVKGR